MVPPPDSSSRQPFWLVLLVVLLLTGLAYLPADWTVGGWTPRPVELLADVRRLPPPPPAAPHHVAPAPSGPAELRAFLTALRRTRRQGTTTRIAYFGDSMIEGDLITGELRQLLQQAFGGAGVGFVPISSAAADFRQTIHQVASADWQRYDLRSVHVPAGHPLGMAGTVFMPLATGSWVRCTASDWAPSLRRFGRLRLFYGPGAGKADAVTLRADQQPPHRYALAGDSLLSELTVKLDSTRQVHLTFACPTARSIYGLSFEVAGGVVLDNLSFRGNSGLWLRKLSPAVLRAFARHQHYDLLVLHYGANVANAHEVTYHNYTRALGRVIRQLQAAFPGASLLLVGMSDKSRRWEGEYLTDPGVPALVAAQQQLAARQQLAFWNLYEAMGGENTMPAWVNAHPALAGHDYTHLTQAGGRRVGRLLYNFLMHQYAATR